MEQKQPLMSIASRWARRYIKPILAKYEFKELDRVCVVNEVLRKIKGRTYLEIGVAQGDVFDLVMAPRKFGVDPKPATEKVRNIRGAKYFSMRSDDFFANEAERIFEQNKIDVALVDGLHEYKQALRDVLHCLDYLNDGGVIVMHDCNPLSEPASVPPERLEAASASPGWDYTWNGDVWKAIVHLRSTRDDVETFVLRCDHGVGIVRKRKSTEGLSYSPDEINAMTFEDLAGQRDHLLDMKPPSYFQTFLKTL